MFLPSVKAIVYVPFILEGECIGMMAFGRIRTSSFTDEEIQQLGTFANQLAVLLKNHQLIREKEKRLLLEERNRIAREIHDGLAQTVAGAMMKLETSQKGLEANIHFSRKLMEEAMEQLRRSLEEIRQSIYALKPLPTEADGLEKALLNYVQKVQKTGNPKIEVEVGGPVFSLTQREEKVIYDTAREAVQNALKHAGAKRIDVSLNYERDRAILTVVDDGKGFRLGEAMIRAKEDGHFGILNIHEEADQIGALVDIDTMPGKGTKVQLIFTKGEGRSS